MDRRYIVTVLFLLVAYLYFTMRRSNYTGSPPDMLDNEKFKDIVITFPLDDSKQEFKDKFLKSEQVARWKAYIISNKGDYYEGEIDTSMSGFVKISFKEIYYGGDVLGFNFHIYFDDTFGNLNNIFIEKYMNTDFQLENSGDSMFTLTPFFASSEYNKRFIYVSWKNGDNVELYGKSWFVNIFPQGRQKVVQKLTHPDLFKNSANNSVRLLIPYEVYLFKIKLELDTIVGLRYVYLSIDEYQVLNISQRYDIFNKTDIGESIPIKYKKTDESNKCLPAEGETCVTQKNPIWYYDPVQGRMRWSDSVFNLTSKTKRFVEYEVDGLPIGTGYYTLETVSIPASHKEECAGCPECEVVSGVKLSECRADGTVLYRNDVNNFSGGCTAEQRALEGEYTEPCKKNNYKITQECQINENGVYKTDTEYASVGTCIERCKNDEKCVAVTTAKSWNHIPKKCERKYWVNQWGGKTWYEECTPAYRVTDLNNGVESEVWTTNRHNKYCKYIGKQQRLDLSCDTNITANMGLLHPSEGGDLVTFRD